MREHLIFNISCSQAVYVNAWRLLVTRSSFWTVLPGNELSDILRRTSQNVRDYVAA